MHHSGCVSTVAAAAREQQCLPVRHGEGRVRQRTLCPQSSVKLASAERMGAWGAGVGKQRRVCSACCLEGQAPLRAGQSPPAALLRSILVGLWLPEGEWALL